MTDEELLNQYVNGNHDTVRVELDKLKPLDAAATAVTLGHNIREAQGDKGFWLFTRRLNVWSQK